MKKLKVMVIGGSASSNFGNSSETVAWPDLLAQNLKDRAEVEHRSQGGLTFIRGVNEIASIDPVNVLIIHFGTSIGWPTPVVKAGTVMGIDFASDYAFHQPVKLSADRVRRFKNFIKRRFRNSVKYALFFVGLYKPRASKRELKDQIEAVMKLSAHKTSRLIWIQHRAYLNPRIALEKAVYERYYTKIMKTLRQFENPGLTILEIPDEFMVAENYLFDCIHLSAIGHERLENMVRDII